MEDSAGNRLSRNSLPNDRSEVQDRELLVLSDTADGSRTLYSSRFGQTFHSHHGAVAESKHVFLEGSGVCARLRAGAATSVLEVGFGTGLNFLLTAQEARTNGAILSYVALERTLLPARVLASLGYLGVAPEAQPALLAFRERLPEWPEEGRYEGKIAGATLELRLGEAQEADLTAARFDAIYHDAFSPDANPELWDAEFLSRLAVALAPDGVLVSYTVKGEVRRHLSAAGLQVSRVPGPPGGKREMLRAARSSSE